MYDENYSLRSVKMWNAHWLTHIYYYYETSKIFDSREDVWFDFDAGNVILERQPKNGLFLGALGEFSTDVNKNISVISEKISTFDNTEIFDELTTPDRWEWVKYTFGVVEENRDAQKEIYIYTNGKNVDYTFDFSDGRYPYWLRSASLAVKRAFNQDSEETQKLFLWLTLEVAWEVSCRVQRLTPSVMALFQKYKAPERGRVLVYANRSLTRVKENERLIVPGYSICLGSLQGLHYNALNWAKLRGRKRITEVDLTNEIVFRLSFSAYSKYETDVINV